MNERITSIIGNPGCGKTKTIIDYCNQQFTKKSDFLIITFSNKAQCDFITKGSKISKLFSNYNCKTVHKLASFISKKLINKTTENNLNTLIISILNLIKNYDISQFLFFKNFKIIFIDEAQDINENQYNLMKEIANNLKIPLVLVGDPNQSIYQFQGGTDKFLLNHSNSDDNKLLLINNYRSSKEIVEFCKYLRPHNDLPAMECKTTITDQKPFIYINKIEEIKQHLLEEIRKGDFPLKDIAIIGPVKLSKTNASIGLQQICNFLDDNKIKYLQYFKDSGNNSATTFDINEKIEVIDDHVNILTIHSSKGLEFKKVLCINFHFNTFSRQPTKEDYNIFKFLWYVAFTRAINKLIIYVDTEKAIFPYIKEVPRDLYESNVSIIKITSPDFKEDCSCLSFPIVDTINNNKYFNENNYYRFEKEFKYTIEEEQLFDLKELSKTNDIYEFNKYSALYGCFFQELFNYYWYINNSSIDDYIDNGIIKLEDKLCISNKEDYNKYLKAIIKLKLRKFIDGRNNINIQLIEKDKNKLTKKEVEFYNYCRNRINCKNKIYIELIITIDLCEYNKSHFISLYQSLLTSENKETVIFNIVLYQYQISNECKRYLTFDWKTHLSSVIHYYSYINNITKNKPHYNFNVVTHNNHLPIHGIIDILDYKNKTLIELKFAKTIDIKYLLQVLLYNNNFYFQNKMEIINLLTGIKYTYYFNKQDNLRFNYYLCDILNNIKMTDNIIILDIETNTIDETKDFTDPQNVEIIERYFYEYNFKTVLSDGLIKNKYKLTTSHITGITEEDFKFFCDDNYDIIKADVNNFMNYMEKPILIAHNGNRFDFPILEFNKIIDYNQIEKKDTLYSLRLFIKDEIKSNKLIELYKKICDKEKIQEHRAKADVKLLIEIFDKLQIKIKNL